MNKTYKIITASLVIALVATTATVFAVRTYRHYHDKAKDKQEQPALDTTHGPVGQGDQTFLWKPRSDTRQGRAAVLLPARIVTATFVTANGIRSVESVGPTDNGNRHAFFMDRSGAAFGAPVRVLAYTSGNKVVYEAIVPNGAARWGKQ